jgi:glycosyltransferase involved in cell wall biosynthesis
MPTVLLEAMRAGLAIVTTRWRSIPEVVGHAAVLVPPGDPSALASALALLLDSEEKRHLLGREARQRFEERFRLERHLEAMESTLRKAVGR